MQSSLFKLPFWSVAVLTLAGCAVGPNYQRPAVNAPMDFRGFEVSIDLKVDAHQPLRCSEVVDALLEVTVRHEIDVNG